MNYCKDINGYITKEIEVLQAINIESINAAMRLLVETLEAKRSIYIFGNGGSAATASHYASDFNKCALEYTDKPFRFLCLNENIPLLTAIANDVGYDEIFRYQLRGRLAPGDIVIGISAGGNSQNVINAVSYAKTLGNKTIGITGYDGGKLKQLADISLHAPVDNMQIAEDIHLMLSHVMVSVLKANLKGRSA
jgi:D-sedoheptulose 7-phosphate isomerase